MIGYFGDIIFETSDKKICNFNDFKQAASANYSEHSRYRKKSEREFIGPNNEGVSFTMTPHFCEHLWSGVSRRPAEV